MISLHIAAMILCAFRLTEIVTQDKISLKIRQRWPIYFLTCSRCVSVWSGLVAMLFYLYAPMVNWPFAISAIWILFFQLLEKVGNHRHIIEFQGRTRLDFREFDMSAPKEENGNQRPPNAIQ